MRTPKPINTVRLELLILGLVVPITLTGCETKTEDSIFAAVTIDPETNLLRVAADNTIRWNGTPVTLAQLEGILKQTADLGREPQLEFRPDLDASYDVYANMLRAIKDAGVTKFGFVGNEQYQATETDH